MHTIEIVETSLDTPLILNKELNLLHLAQVANIMHSKEFVNVIMCCVSDERITESNCPIIIEGHNDIKWCIGFSETGDIECDNGLCYNHEKCKRVIGAYGLTLYDNSQFKELSIDFVAERIQQHNFRETYDNKVTVEYIDNTYIHIGSGKYHDDEPVKMKRILNNPDKILKLDCNGKLHPKQYTQKYFSLQEMKHNLRTVVGLCKADKEFNLEKWIVENM